MQPWKKPLGTEERLGSQHMARLLRKSRLVEFRRVGLGGIYEVRSQEKVTEFVRLRK